MAQKNLEDVLKSAGNPVDMLRNSQIGAYVYPVVPPSSRNWRDEQRAWRETCRAVRPVAPHGRALRRGSRRAEAAARTWRSTASRISPSNRAKQFVPCSYDGYVIGDGILFHLDENKLRVRRPRADGELDPVPRRDRRLQRRRSIKDDRSPVATRRARRSSARHYRYPDPGPERREGHREAERRPDAGHQVLQHGRRSTIAGRKVRALRHGMAGAPGPRDLGPVRRARGDPRRRSSRPARSSACARSARAPTRPTRSSRAGFRRRCRPSTPARR